jgi:Cu+-exporting ATPase
MELDPVCGMTVDPARAKSHVEHANKTYSFCSEGCAKKFSSEPAKYLNSKQTPSMATAASLEAINIARPQASKESAKA